MSYNGNEPMRKVFSEFFLDGGKIIFGSLVVGAFLPTLPAPIKWYTVAVGIIIAVGFVTLAGLLSKNANQ